MKARTTNLRILSFSALIVVLTFLASNLSAQDGLKIDKAYCGAAASWRDVTAFLQRQVRGDTLSATLAQPYEEIGGDPASGQGKHLIIDYHLHGQSFRLVIEEQFPIGFSVRLPSPEAAAPGADPQASALMAAISTQPTHSVESWWPDRDHWLMYLALGTSLVAILCACAALVQIRQIKKQLRAPPILPREADRLG